jgi:hypothetical protein
LGGGGGAVFGVKFGDWETTRLGDYEIERLVWGDLPGTCEVPGRLGHVLYSAGAQVPAAGRPGS